MPVWILSKGLLIANTRTTGRPQGLD
jgi:hypothetical protein